MQVLGGQVDEISNCAMVLLGELPAVYFSKHQKTVKTWEGLVVITP